MAPDSQVLLALLAVRIQGTNASAKLDVFKKLKPYLTDALAQGLIEESKVPVVKNGKPQKKTDTVIDLTAAGRSYLETHGGANAQTAVVAAKARELEQQLKADRDALRAEILGSTGKKTKSGDPSKEIKALALKLEALAQALAKLEDRLKQEEGGDVVARIDAAFAALEKKLQSRFGLPVTAESAPVPKPAHAPTSSAASLRSALRDAYETLCLFIEFDSGVVEVPRLYHETRKAMPSLTVHAFHQELESLWSQRVLELKVLNEVRSAKEPDKAIRRGENLYYFVFWPNS